MSAPRARLKWGRNGWEKIDQPAPVDNTHHLGAAIHHLAARVTSIEQQLASLTNPATPPKRGRKPSVAPQGN
jgi:hypothetical protein